MAAHAETAPPQYYVYQLASNPDYSAAPTAINHYGQIVGTLDVYRAGGLDRHMFITGRNGRHLLDLGAPEGTQPLPLSVNAQGVIVGHLFTALGTFQPMITGPNGTDIRELRLFADQTSGTAYGVNDAGQVTGTVCRSRRGVEACNGFVTGANAEGVTMVGSTRTPTTPSAINNLGQVVGSVSVPDGSNHKNQAFVTAPGQPSQLHPFGSKGTAARVINDSGDVAGYSNNYKKAFRINENHGPVQSYIAPDPYDVMLITGIDARGNVGGSLSSGSVASRSFVIDVRGSLFYMDDIVVNLNGATVSNIRAVNDRGQMAVYVSGVGPSIACLTLNCASE